VVDDATEEGSDPERKFYLETRERTIARKEY
jgi:hypothetical protein